MEKVTADSSIIETVQMHPEIVNIFMQYGLAASAAWPPTSKPSARAPLPTAST